MKCLREGNSVLEKSDLLHQLGDLQKWKRSGKTVDFRLIDYVFCVGTPDLLFGYAELLVPELIEQDGALFIAERFDQDTYHSWMSRLNDQVAVQRVMNHLHLSSLLQDQEVSDNVAREAAIRIASVWSRVFAEKGLVGEVYGSTLDDLEVSLVAAKLGDATEIIGK